MSTAYGRPFHLTRAIAAATAIALGAALAMPAVSHAATTAAGVPILPAEQQFHGIAYTSGGVSQESASAFRKRMDDYPLAIEIAQKQAAGAKHDEFTAGAEVHITHAGKTVFRAKAEGPFMLVRLEPGKYSMSVSLGKRTLHKKDFVVQRGHTTHATFEFPAETA